MGVKEKENGCEVKFKDGRYHDVSFVRVPKTSKMISHSIILNDTPSTNKCIKNPDAFGSHSMLPIIFFVASVKDSSEISNPTRFPRRPFGKRNEKRGERTFGAYESKTEGSCLLRCS